MPLTFDKDTVGPITKLCTTIVWGGLAIDFFCGQPFVNAIAGSLVGGNHTFIIVFILIFYSLALLVPLGIIALFKS
ncbi:MAG: hypothetical protein WCO35_02050 [Candidatus Nomurabacteria bacterium]